MMGRTTPVKSDSLSVIVAVIAFTRSGSRLLSCNCFSNRSRKRPAQAHFFSLSYVLSSVSGWRDVLSVTMAEWTAFEQSMHVAQSRAPKMLCFGGGGPPTGSAISQESIISWLWSGNVRTKYFSISKTVRGSGR